MRCPFCGYVDQKVLDSRPAREGEAIRRRRECLRCNRRFTTFEEPEKPRLFVVKRGGDREEFSREKCLSSMLIACRKRPVSVDVLRDAVDRIERDLFQEFEDEVPSPEIGERVMNELRTIDQVAYVRFASVYREFETVSDFRAIVDAVDGGVRRKREKAGAGALGHWAVAGNEDRSGPPDTSDPAASRSPSARRQTPSAPQPVSFTEEKI